MSPHCEQVQATLADHGPAGLRDDPGGEAHLVGCDDCLEVLEALVELDAELPGRAEADVDPRALDQLLAQVAAEPPEIGVAPPPPEGEADDDPDVEVALPPLPTSDPGLLLRFGARTRVILAASLALLAGTAAFLTLGGNFEPPMAGLFETADQEVVSTADRFARVELPAPEAAPMEELELGGAEGKAQARPSGGAGARRLIQKRRDKRPRDGLMITTPSRSRGRDRGAPDQSVSARAREYEAKKASEAQAKDDAKNAAEARVAEDLRAQVDALVAPSPEADGDAYYAWNQPAKRPAAKEKAERSALQTLLPATPPEETRAEPALDANRALGEEQANARVLSETAGLLPTVKTVLDTTTVFGGDGLDDGVSASLGALSGVGGKGRANAAGAAEGTAEGMAADRFVAERASLDAPFVEAAGYWMNTYVPGDPQLRGLAGRLSGIDRSALSPQPAMLDRLSRTVPQPFDPPSGAALGVYLRSDQRGLDGPRRAIVQVGLQGTPRRAGRRPAMNVGVVLDLRDAPTPERGAAVRALLDALTDARDLGDRFSLTVVGRSGGMVIPPGSFRYGPVSVASKRLLSPAAEDEDGPTLTLREAVELSRGSVSAGDDPTAPLGSSLVLIVAPRGLDAADTATLVPWAHRSAVEGIPVSVVGVGEEFPSRPLEQVALAGQGNHRRLATAADAEDLVERELAAVSDVVARAVRLRIRLAPGVKLIDVLGSRRLDAARAQEVRDAEQSIDRRLSRNLGIQADRGEDEEGIQIVIPAYYAGDAHTVLLDVVLPGPGPVADVTVRFKDLVNLRNGTARANLSLDRDRRAPGPLELNVVQNHLTFEVSTALREAGDALRSGRSKDATARLLGAAALVRGMRARLPQLARDPALATDLRMLDEYLVALADSSPPMLAESLEYAGRLKLLTPSDRRLQ